MSKRRTICSFENSILKKIGWTEEDWHWYWFCMYQEAVNAHQPAMANVMVHYSEIPTELIIKFTEKYVS